MNKAFMKSLAALAGLFFVSLLWGIPHALAEEAAGELDALIVTGQNSHNWEESSQVLKKVLEDTGLFRVDLAVYSEGSQRTFHPDFRGYRVVVLDFCGGDWPERTKRAFVEYVRGGGGVVVYHNAGNAFPDWPEYLQIIGLGGGDRSGEAGPFVYWEKQGPALDKSGGFAGRHGYVHDFSVEIRDSEHPVTAGLPQRWMHAADELYGLLRGNAPNLRILATSHSDLLQKGTGRHEPVLFVNSFGQGRIFHTTLGHASGKGPFPALECVGFIVTFQRGAEWAATGQVTQNLPADFPVLLRETASAADVRRWKDYTPPRLDKIFEKLSAYEYGQDEDVLSRLREFVLSHKDSPDSRIESEQKLAAFLESGASLAGKMAVCRQLRLIGTARSVPVLEKMLLAEETCDMARFALEKIPGKEAEAALVSGLSLASSGQRIGSIASLGQRKSASAVPELGRLLDDPDPLIRMASARALGHIAGSQAAGILSSALDEARDESSIQLATALLSCADQFRIAEETEQAAALYERLCGISFPVSVRVAAWKGLIASGGERGKKVLFDLLEDPDPDLHAAAISQITELLNDRDISELTARLMEFPPNTQASILFVLPQYPKEIVLPAVLEAVESGFGIVRVSALEVLRQIGDASVVALLAGYASGGRGDVQKAARESLWNLRGPEVDHSVLLLLFKHANPSIERELVRCVGERRISAGKHILFDLILASSDPRLRNEAARNLENIVDQTDIPRLLDLLIASGGEAEKAALRRAVVSASSKIPVKSMRAASVREKLAEVENESARGELYRVMGGIGDESVLPLLRLALRKKGSESCDGAVRAFIEWPDTTVKDDLLWIARTSDNPVHRVLALRACLEMAGKDRFRRPASTVEFFERGLELATRDEEKTLILSLLPRFPCVESLNLAASLLSEKTVQEEAGLAVQKILFDLMKNRYYMFY